MADVPLEEVQALIRGEIPIQEEPAVSEPKKEELLASLWKNKIVKVVIFLLVIFILLIAGVSIYRTYFIPVIPVRPPPKHTETKVETKPEEEKKVHFAEPLVQEPQPEPEPEKIQPQPEPEPVPEQEQEPEQESEDNNLDSILINLNNVQVGA